MLTRVLEPEAMDTADEAAEAHGDRAGAAEAEDDAAGDAQGESDADEPFAAVFVGERPRDQKSGDQPEDVEGEEQVDLDGAVPVDLPIHQQQRREVIATPGRHGDRGGGSAPGSGRDG